jgi:DNA-binding NtrC family response regulator
MQVAAYKYGMSQLPHILLVEDDDSTRELLEEILEVEGYKITSVANGLAAKELLKKEKFNLLITDFKMPGLNGVELLAWCIEEKITSPMIFMTAETNLIPEESSALSEAHAIIVQKPLNLVYFFSSIKKMLESNL